MPCLAELGRLTQLSVLVVKDVVPGPASYLPKSLRKLTLECEEGLENYKIERAVVQAWLSCHIRPSLQQLHLKGMVWWEKYSERLDFTRLSKLKELHFVPSLLGGGSKWELYQIPSSLTQLSNLEVLQVASTETRYPFNGRLPHFTLSSRGPRTQFLSSCTRLRSLGYVCLDPTGPYHGHVSFNGHLPHLSSLQLKVNARMPEMINPSCFPSLQHLVVECECVTPSMVQCLAQMTALTCLQLSSGAGFYRSMCGSMGGWCGLEPLGHSLLLLQRLELVSYFGSKDYVSDIGIAANYKELVVPNLSAFTQLKQLQLACALVKHPAFQPNSAAFLARLSQLTQLEQVEVIGYNSITPELLTGLVSCLPRLRALMVGLCRHPDVMGGKGQQAGGLGEGAGGLNGEDELLPVHQGFAQASKACEGLRPGLRVQVGYNLQWRPGVRCGGTTTGD
jgi:hypothetical protein